MLKNYIYHGLRTRIRTQVPIIGTSARIKQFHNCSIIRDEILKDEKQKEVSLENKNDKDVKEESKEVPTDSVLDVPISVELGRKVDGELVKNYVDTMYVFNQLKKLGFNNGQSDVILKLLNENLTVQLDKMDNKYTSSMEMENESYLFEAAQSELRIEINTSRELDLNTLENEKNSLDNLLREESEELNKLLIVSKNDTQVLINDQNSENTLMQKKIKLRIRELDNKISTNINSDIKSEVESLRWQTTRNGIFAILILVFTIMGGTSISKRINREEQPTEVILHTIRPEEHLEDEVDEEDDQALQKDQKKLI